MLQLLKSVLQKFSGCERGSTMLELAVSVPVLVSLSAGIFEFGNLIQKKLLIEAGLRDAARYSARCNTSLTGLNCSTASQNIAVTGTHDGSGAARVYNWTAGDVSVVVRDDEAAKDVATNTQLYRSLTPFVHVVRVSTSYTYSGTSLLTFLGFGPISIVAAHEERFLGF